MYSSLKIYCSSSAISKSIKKPSTEEGYLLICQFLLLDLAPVPSGMVAVASLGHSLGYS